MEKIQKHIKFTLNKGAYTMTETFSVIHLSYKLHPWGYPWKLIRSERGGKKLKTSQNSRKLSFKHSSIKNLTMKFFPPLPLFFFQGDQDPHIENHFGPPRSRKPCTFKYRTYLKLKILQATLPFQTANSLEELWNII